MWTITIDRKVEKELDHLSGVNRQRILRFLQERLAPADDPRIYGEALVGRFSGYWRYRVGDYRIVAAIQDRILTIYVVSIGNRREVYR